VPVTGSSCAFPVVPASLPSSRPPLFTSIGSVSSFTGPLRFFSCPVSSPEGLHCPRGSFIHAPFCRFHLREKLGLDITPSTIPSAGFGLFTLSARAKGEHLVEYMGPGRKWSPAIQRVMLASTVFAFLQILLSTR